MKNVFLISLALALALVTGCRSNDGNKGAWDDHAKHAIDVGRAGLEKNGVQVSGNPKPVTKFIQADGVYKGVWPYVNQQGGMVGGYWVGNCGYAGTATLAKSGPLWNRNTGTHEAHHALEAFAKCEGGHPDYMRKYAGSPDWPYFTGNFALLSISQTEAGQMVTEVNVHVEDDEGNMACVTYLQPDRTAPGLLSESGSDVKIDSERLAFARSLLQSSKGE
jgi:hypothetical protein